MFLVDSLYKKLETREPFCFLKINDGECAALKGPNNALSRGDEISTNLMTQCLREVVDYKNKNYFVGGPCPRCDASNFSIFKSYRKGKCFLSNSFINANYSKSMEIFIQTMHRYNKIVIVLNEKIPLEKRNDLLQILNINPDKVLFLPVASKNTFDEFYYKYEMKGYGLDNNTLCLFLCGPLGRVLAKCWYEQNNSLTCIELGSFFDPILRNKTYLYQNGGLPYCKQCNASASPCRFDIKDMENETFYIFNQQQMLDFYNHDYEKVLTNCQNLQRKMPDMQLWKDIISFCQEKITKPMMISIQDDSLLYEKSNVMPQFCETPFQIFIFIQDMNHIQDVFLALVNAKLYNEINCKEIQFGVSVRTEREIIELFSEFVCDISIVQMESEHQFYQHIQKTSEHDFMYYHTNHQSADQREYLQYFTMNTYKTSIKRLNHYDVVGCNFYSFENDWIEKPFSFRYYTPIFSGNCFWCSVKYFRTLDLSMRQNFALELYICSNPNGRFYSYHTSGYDFYLSKFPNQNCSRFSRSLYKDHEKYRLNYCILKKNGHHVMSLFQYLMENVFSKDDKVSVMCEWEKYSILETFFPKTIHNTDSQIIITDNVEYNNDKKTIIYIGNVNNETSMVFVDKEDFCHLTLKVQGTWIDISKFSHYREKGEAELVNEIHKTTNTVEEQQYQCKLCKFYLDCFELEKDKVYVDIFYIFLTLLHGNDRDILEKKMEELYCSIDKEYQPVVLSYLEKIYLERTKNEIPKQIFFIHLDQRNFEEYNYTCVFRCYELMSQRFEIIIYNDREPKNKWWEKMKQDCPKLQILSISRKHQFEGFPVKYVQYEADILRLSLLYNNGGTYMDTDMYLLKPFDNLLSLDFELFISKENRNGNGLINSILISSKGNGFLKLWQEYFNYALRKNIWAYHIRETNALLMKKQPYLKMKHRIQILDSKHFFPYTWQEHDKIMAINNDTLRDDPECYGIHLFETIKNDVLQKHPHLCPSQRR